MQTKKWEQNPLFAIKNRINDLKFTNISQKYYFVCLEKIEKKRKHLTYIRQNISIQVVTKYWKHKDLHANQDSILESIKVFDILKSSDKWWGFLE